MDAGHAYGSTGCEESGASAYMKGIGCTRHFISFVLKVTVLFPITKLGFLRYNHISYWLLVDDLEMKQSFKCDLALRGQGQIVI